MAGVRVAGAMRLLLPLLLLTSQAFASGSKSTPATPYSGGDAGLPPISRSSFPKGFVFGTAGAAYQYEGAAFEGGKGIGIWDTFAHQHPEKIADRSNGDVALDSYHRYKEDVKAMTDMGMDAYRFSISWPRILPKGNLKGGVNREGVRYYNNLINELMSKGIKPFVTLSHWDPPQALEDKYKGFLSRTIIDDFKDFTEVCFKEFGDRVKHWITFNEPFAFCSAGYATGLIAPGRCSPYEQGNCSVGDSGTEPYTACHNLLLAHSESVQLYKQKYQAVQKGEIGITLVSIWFVPYSNSKADVYAAKRAIDFMFGWFMDPIIRGEYPQTMRTLVGNRLPRFTPAESKLIKGSFDFIGLNYYTGNYAQNLPPSNSVNVSYSTDVQAKLTSFRNGVAIGPPSASSWLYIYPQGFRELLLYIKGYYGNPTLYITENGVGDLKNDSLPLQQALNDDVRIGYYHKHLLALQSAMRDGVKVKGYFAWSLMDNFEWVNGYTVRFGIYFIDYLDNLKRIPKKSAFWFKQFLRH